MYNNEFAALFQKYGVLTKREFMARNDIYVERYCKDVATESKLCLNIAKKQILPAGYRYQGELATTAAALKAAGKDPDTSSLDRASELVGELESSIAALEQAIHHEATGGLLDHAKHYRDEVIPAMMGVRKVADTLETLISDDLWPLPTYQEMLFIK